MAKRTETNPSGLKKEEFDALDSEARYTLWVMGDVPDHWYGDNTDDHYGQIYHGQSCGIPRTALPVVIQPQNKKRQAQVWRPKYESNYVPWDACHQALIRVEDAIRETNPEIAKTPRIISHS